MEIKKKMCATVEVALKKRFQKDGEPLNPHFVRGDAILGFYFSRIFCIP